MDSCCSLTFSLYRWSPVERSFDSIATPLSAIYGQEEEEAITKFIIWDPERNPISADRHRNRIEKAALKKIYIYICMHKLKLKKKTSSKNGLKEVMHQFIPPFNIPSMRFLKKYINIFSSKYVYKHLYIYLLLLLSSSNAALFQH